jgi:Domain of unknown function (DUF4145)
MNKSLYAQLDHLIETMPDLAAFTLPPEALAWVGQAQGLVYAIMGNSQEVVDLEKASGRLGSIAYRWEAAQQIVAIVHRVRTRARSVVRRRAPDWTHELEDQELFALLEELYGALNNEYMVLAAIGVRTAFDIATESLGIDPSLSFAEKLKKAQSDGHVGTKEKEALEVIVNAGSAAAHRGWKPTHDELAAMMDALESFLQRAFFTNRKVAALKGAVPPRR